jgi:GNAT superfamily N-acetyltransferase
MTSTKAQDEPRPSQSETPVITYYLEMQSPDALRPARFVDDLDIVEIRNKQYQFNRFLYRFIGKTWQWTDKLSWTTEQWREYVASERQRTWVAYCGGAIAGYYELLGDDLGNTEIIYFGLSEAYIGNGLGGYLLTHAIRSAWEWPATRRVWVHTCTLDHPAALGNYLARGMTLYRQESS